jgi:hypothetical protein
MRGPVPHPELSRAAPIAPAFSSMHGFIFPVAWIVSLFMPGVAVFGQRPKFTLSACLAGSRRAVPNDGGWYDFGYFLGIVWFGVGARQSVKIQGARHTGVHATTTTIHHEERG